jgi:hypothetical protein
MNIGLYHAQHPKSYRNVTLKVILTNANHVDDTTANLLSYFSTNFNQGVRPGGFIWAPGVIFQEPTQRSPWQSMQIFREYMDDTTLLNGLTTVSPKSNVTSGIFTCTTIDNAAFGVKGGQKILLMLIRLNSVIPTNIFSINKLDQWKKPLATMAYNLATDEELANRIKDFAQL